VTDQALARRNILLLALAQALYSCCVITVFSYGSLVGLNIAPTPGLATAPITTFVLGALFSTIPASLLMQKIGRPPVFIVGATFCLAGALLAVWAIYNENFMAFCFATALYGVFQATSGYYRFAAAESATVEMKSIAISWVLTGGVVAAVAGTLLAGATSELVAGHIFAGSFAATGVLALVNIAVITLLRLPRPSAGEISGPQRSWAELLRQRKLIVAMASAIIAYGMMNLMMTAAPVAMVGCGFTKDDAKWVIQWHVLAMFIPSFFTGQLINRFGVERITAIGMVILTFASVAALLGITFGHFAVALILLGLGWNFGFIGGTTMLTDCYKPSERGKVQAANDFGISALMAVASLSSGALLAEFGWSSVAMAIFPPVTLALVLLAWLVVQKPHAA
jgi:MFS family permease